MPHVLFSTPRKRKQATSLRPCPSPTTWPRIGEKVPATVLKDVTSQIFGYEPRDWQVKITEKVLEGYDAIGLAGTGAGKSLVFAMLAIATELAGFKGLVIVICPLKSLQKDQVGLCQSECH
jgi:superfamily II DNA helicase RecQ